MYIVALTIVALFSFAATLFGIYVGSAIVAAIWAVATTLWVITLERVVSKD